MGCGSSKVEQFQEIASLKDGFYTNVGEGDKSQTLFLQQGHCEIKSIFAILYPDLDPTFSGEIHVGQFGKAIHKFSEHFDKEEIHYNIKFEVKSPKPMPIIEPKYHYGHYSEGKMVIFLHKKTIIPFQWVEAEELRKKFYETSQRRQSLKCPYELRPESPGSLIWIQGLSGSGKSTVGQLMAKENGFVYYEGDGPFISFTNPFVDPNSDKNPTKEVFEQNLIRDVPFDVLQARRDYEKEFMRVIKMLRCDKWQKLDWSYMGKVTEFVAEDIKFQRSRIGGNFVVAHAFPRLFQRNIIRKYNPDCIFVFLRVSKKLQKERLTKRHPDDKMTVKMIQFLTGKIQEFPEEDDTIFIDVTEDKSPADIKTEIIRILLDKGVSLASPLKH